MSRLRLILVGIGIIALMNPLSAQGAVTSFTDSFDSYGNNAFIVPASLANDGVPKIVTGSNGWNTINWTEGASSSVDSVARQSDNVSGYLGKALNFSNGGNRDDAMFSTSVLLNAAGTVSVEPLSKTNNGGDGTITSVRGLVFHLAADASSRSGYFVGVSPTGTAASPGDVAITVTKWRNGASTTLLAKTDTDVPWNTSTTTVASLGTLQATVIDATHFAVSIGSYSTIVTDATNPLSSGYAGVWIDSQWSGHPFDNFSVAVPEPLCFASMLLMVGHAALWRQRRE